MCINISKAIPSDATRYNLKGIKFKVGDDAPHYPRRATWLKKNTSPNLKPDYGSESHMSKHEVV